MKSYKSHQETSMCRGLHNQGVDDLEEYMLDSKKSADKGISEVVKPLNYQWTSTDSCKDTLRKFSGSTSQRIS